MATSFNHITSSDKDILVKNCTLIATTPEANLVGYVCYNGNVIMIADGLRREVAARLWVNGDSGVLVYND